MARPGARTGGFGPLLRQTGVLAALGLVALLGLAAAPSYGNWRRVLDHRSKTHPFLACRATRGVRCHLISDPTRGSRHNGPVGAGAITAGPELEMSPALRGNGVEGGFSPENLRSAYKLPSTTAGTGQTVAIVDAFDDPDAEADMNEYRSHYGIAPCGSGCFRKVNEEGGSTRPSPSAEWAEEISLDLDMVSAVCPNCHILLVEASNATSTSLAKAVNEAVVLGATEISNSYGSLAGQEPAEVSAYHHPGIPITVAAGDEGYLVEVPADNPNVIAVGGTSLVPESNKRGWKETVWYDSEEGEISGTGSGCSPEPKPSWQTEELDPLCAFRTNDDIAAVADQNTPVSVYDTYKTPSKWNLEGGTSVATPIVAADMALSNSYTRSFNGAHALYVDSLFDKSAFNDVTIGKNGNCGTYLCEAKVGYDGPTGLGTPIGAPEAPPPVLVTKAASGVGAGEATLNATIDPNDVTFSKCRFEYGPTTSYGSSVTAACPPETPESGTTAVPVTAHITGLNAASTYHFRVAASYQGQSGAGGDSSFSTTGAAPSVATEPASAITPEGAKLNAVVDPNGSQVTTCTFEYGTPPSYGLTAPCKPSPGAGQSFVTVSAEVTHLTPETTYHFRIVAANASGELTGSERSFKTAAVLPAVVTGTASGVSPAEATLNGTVNPDGVEVTGCTFEYGPSATYGNSVPCSALPGAGHAPVAVSAPVEGLSPGHPYHFRIVASNAKGTSEGDDEGFSTTAEPPSALTEAAVATSPTTETLTGTATPNGAAIDSCRFEYGTSPAGVLEASVPCSSLPSGSEESASVSAVVGGLAAGTTYHYRLVAGNASGVAYGATLAFTTAPATLGGGQPLEEITGGQGQPGPGRPTLASTRLSATRGGSLSVPVRCPAGASSCSGKISLQLVLAVGATSRTPHRADKRVVLAAGPFRVLGGRVSTVRLQLSHLAKSLLRRAHTLRASATLTPATGRAARTTVTIRSR